MRTISQCRNLQSPYSMTTEERVKFKEWIDKKARYTYDSYDFCCLLGWFVLEDDNIPLSPKEAGFD